MQGLEELTIVMPGGRTLAQLGLTRGHERFERNLYTQKLSEDNS